MTGSDPTSPTDSPTIPEPQGHVVPGMPVWLELGTPDPERAAAFYGALLGWQFRDMGEEFGHYTMVHLDDAPVAAYMSTDPKRNPYASGAEAGWTVYLATADIAGAAERAPKLGGSTLFEPMPVGDLGTSALLADPLGAQVGLWQPGGFAGTRPDGRRGTACWYELTTRSIAKVGDFYAGVLGVEVAEDTEEMGAGDGGDGYGLLRVRDGDDDWSLAGLWQAPGALPDGVGGVWGANIAVASLDDALRVVELEGGAVLGGPAPSPYGTVADIVDDQGARTRLMELGEH